MRPLHYSLFFLILSGCTGLPQWKQPSVKTKANSPSSDSPMSQLGAALPAMKPGDERKLKIIAADQMAEHGFWNEAVELYLQAEAMASEKPKLDAQLAPAFAGAGQFAESLERYRRLVSNQPKNAELISNMAFTLMESGDTVSAEAEFRRALSIDPNHQNAAVNLGLLMARQRRSDEALALLSPVVGEAAAHHNLGVIAIECGDESLARQEFTRASQLPGAPKTTQAFLAALSK